MAHKVHPKIIRVGITEDWDSVWFSNPKKYKKNLKEDVAIRNFLKERLEKGILEKVRIERTGNKVHIIIRTPKPGVVIGRGGEGVEMLSKEIAKRVKDKEIKIDIEEVKDPSLSASVVAQQIAMDIERRVPFRRAVKRAIERILQKREIEGLKIKVKGRLNGAEIARSETFKEGKLPLQTLRSDIDYKEQRANCTYGVVSVKVWLYKGEKV
jgi:small subunit ribosomal protein S3